MKKIMGIIILVIAMGISLLGCGDSINDVPIVKEDIEEQDKNVDNTENTVETTENEEDYFDVYAILGTKIKEVSVSDVKYRIYSNGYAEVAAVESETATIQKKIEIEGESYKVVALDAVHKNWESFEIPKHIKYILQNAFVGCRIKSITIPDTVEYISGFGTFDNSMVEQVEFPKNIKTDKHSFLFSGCPNLKTVDVPNGVEVVSGFEDSGVVSVNLPNTVKTIEMDTFVNCPNLVEVKIPDSVVTIKRGAFKECTSLKELKLPEGIRVISLWIAQDSALEELIIPDSVVNYLEDLSLSDMPQLKKIKFSNSVDYVPEISYCPLLELVVLPDEIENVSGLLDEEECSGRTITIQAPEDKVEDIKKELTFCNVVAK